MRRYLKAQFVVLLCGGLVGPIFLAVYFATGQGSVDKWMFYIGLLVTAGDVLGALALAWFGARSATRVAELERTGVLALARVTGITETGTRINDQPLVKLQLHVEGPGLTAFDTETRVIASVARLGSITAGKLVVVVDPAAGGYEVDWERSALVNGLLPAQFSVDGDDKTYDLTGQPGPLMEILRLLKANHIPLSGTVDVRSDPVLRRQIREVLHRAAEQPPAPATEPGASASTAASIGERLQRLAELHRQGVLTDEEYTSKRAQIIAEI